MWVEGRCGSRQTGRAGNTERVNRSAKTIKLKKNPIRTFKFKPHI